MLRAFLASIFVVLAVSAAPAVVRAPASAAGDNYFASKFNPLPVREGEDQIDVEKQPCFSPQDWSGKTAVRAHAAAFRNEGVSLAAKIAPPEQRSPAHLLFLHACAARAPPPLFHS